MARVCLAHDYLTQRGGAERVALTLLRAFPGSPMLTSVYTPERTFPGFAEHDVRTGPLQDVAPFRRDPRLALPLLARAWSRTVVTGADADVVLASSSGWAHGVTTTPDVGKIVYCHNPARWLYQQQDYVAGHGARAAVLAPLRSRLTRWDAAAAHSADRYLANSTSVARRIEHVYGIEAEVLSPPVSVDTGGARTPVAGLEPGFVLTVARGRGYKNTAVVEEAVSGLRGERLVVVGGAGTDAPAPDGVRRLGVVSDSELRWLYANARALVSASHEDFGLTPLEANAFGTPVVVLRAGGFLDTLDEGVSGVFFDRPQVEDVRAALRELPDLDPVAVRRHAARYSPERFAVRLAEVVDEVTGTTSVALPADGERVHAA